MAAGAIGPSPDTVRPCNDGRFAVSIARSLLWLDEHRAALERALR
ncbi:hypothetical protein [Saccharopolyspora taberi]